MAAAVQVEVGHLCVAHSLQLLERAVFEPVDAQSGGGGIDAVLPVLAEVRDAGSEALVGEIASGHLAVLIDQQSHIVGYNPDASGVVLEQVVHGVHFGQSAVELVGRVRILHLEQSVSGGSHEEASVVCLQEAGHIAGHLALVEVFHGDILELTAVVGLQRAVHAHIEESALCLEHTVHIVAGHALGIIFLVVVEFVSVVLAEAVSCDHPDKAVVVEVDLVDEAAREVVVGPEQLSVLRRCRLQ